MTAPPPTGKVSGDGDDDPMTREDSLLHMLPHELSCLEMKKQLEHIKKLDADHTNWAVQRAAAKKQYFEEVRIHQILLRRADLTDELKKLERMRAKNLGRPGPCPCIAAATATKQTTIRPSSRRYDRRSPRRRQRD